MCLYTQTKMWLRYSYSSDSPSPLLQSTVNSGDCTSFTLHLHCGSPGVCFSVKMPIHEYFGNTHSINVGWLEFKCWLMYLIIYTALGVYWNASLQPLILEALESVAASPVGFVSYRRTNQNRGREEGPRRHPALCIFHEE